MNTAFKNWGLSEVQKIAREWAEKRSADNEAALQKSPVYQRFIQEATSVGNPRAIKIADKLVRAVSKNNLVGGESDQQKVVQLCIDYVQFDAFWDLAHELSETDSHNTTDLLKLFREWEIVESKEMMRVTEGRIATIEKLEQYINTNALEVPTLHNFLKEFPWVLDPRWTMVADEVTYSKLLSANFPESEDVPESDRRIDFLCVRESVNLIVVEIKRPHSKIGVKELDQIRDYVIFMQDYIQRTTDKDFRFQNVVGYLLCGDTVDTYDFRGRRQILEKSDIFVRQYSDLLRMVQSNHKEILQRYNQLTSAKVVAEQKRISSLGNA